MSNEKWLHVQEKVQNNKGISVLEKEPYIAPATADVQPQHNSLIEKWVDVKTETAFNHIYSGDGIIDLMIEQEGESVCKSAAAEDAMSEDMRRIEAPFVTDTKFKRLGGTFRRY